MNIQTAILWDGEGKKALHTFQISYSVQPGVALFPSDSLKPDGLWFCASQHVGGALGSLPWHPNRPIRHAEAEPGPNRKRPAQPGGSDPRAAGGAALRQRAERRRQAGWNWVAACVCVCVETGRINKKPVKLIATAINRLDVVSVCFSEQNRSSFPDPMVQRQTGSEPQQNLLVLEVWVRWKHGGRTDQNIWADTNI